MDIVPHDGRGTRLRQPLRRAYLLACLAVLLVASCDQATKVAQPARDASVGSDVVGVPADAARSDTAGQVPADASVNDTSSATTDAATNDAATTDAATTADDATSPPTDAGTAGGDSANPDANDPGFDLDGGGDSSFALTATGQPGSVRLSWNASTMQRLRGYHIYRSTAAGTGYARIGQTGNATLSYLDSTNLVTNQTYHYVVAAYDNQNNESPFSNEAAAAPLPRPPVANAGADKTAMDFDGDGVENIGLDGSGSSDPDGDIASYLWKEGDTVLSAQASFSASFAVGEHTLTLTVTDGGGNAASDTVLVTVYRKPIDPGAGAAAIQGYWVWMQVVENGVVTWEITEQDMVWTVGEVWPFCIAGYTCLRYGIRLVAFDSISNRAHWVKRVTTGSDFQAAATYAVDSNNIAFNVEETFSCSHPISDRVNVFTEYTQFMRVGDQLWLGVADGYNIDSPNGDGVPPFFSAPVTSEPTRWLVLRAITKEEFHGRYSYNYCGAARDGVDSCHACCNMGDVFSVYY